jgi:hypothetical protein
MYRSVAAFLIALAAASPAHEYEVYVGGPDCGVDLVYRDGGFVCGWPGGVLWERDFIPFEGCCNEILFVPLPHADTDVVNAAHARLAEFGDIHVTMETMELEAVHDPGAAVWVVEAEPAVPPESVLRMAQYLRAKAGLVREGWLGFVADRVLALTGWGALFVEVEDGSLGFAEYQPYDYSAHSQLREWGVIAEDEEYADHPEANGIAEWAVVEGISPIVEGSFTLGYAIKFD